MLISKVVGGFVTLSSCDPFITKYWLVQPCYFKSRTDVIQWIDLSQSSHTGNQIVWTLPELRDCREGLFMLHYYKMRVPPHPPPPKVNANLILNDFNPKWSWKLFFPNIKLHYRSGLALVFLWTAWFWLFWPLLEAQKEKSFLGWTLNAACDRVRRCFLLSALKAVKV